MQTEPGKKPIERDSITCGHCSFIDFVPPGKQPADHCKMCDRFVCVRCAALPYCRPFERRLEEMEAKGRLLQACIGDGEAEQRERLRIDMQFLEKEEFNRKLQALWAKKTNAEWADYMRTMAHFNERKEDDEKYAAEEFEQRREKIRRANGII